MKLWIFIFIALVVVLLAWQLWFTLSIGIREPRFLVDKQQEGYEIRTYMPFVTAEVVVQGSYEEAINKGFKILFHYSSGCNAGQVRMPMLAPVLVEKGVRFDDCRVSFVMPFEYTLETLPKPRNQCIHVELEQKKVVAAMRFNGRATASLVSEKQNEFVEALARDRVRMCSAIRLARYHPPFILPWFMRNELLVDVESEQ